MEWCWCLVCCRNYWSIYQHGEGWGHLEGWIKRVIISALLLMSSFLWWVWTMRRMATHSRLSAILSIPQAAKTLPPFHFPLPLFPVYGHPYLPSSFFPFFLLFISWETCCDPSCATDQHVRPYGYPEQPFSCSWGLFQSVYSFWKLVSEFCQYSFENLMGCEHSKVNWDDCPCLLPGTVLPILGVLLWKCALCHKASISVEWSHLEETKRKCQE